MIERQYGTETKNNEKQKTAHEQEPPAVSPNISLTAGGNREEGDSQMKAMRVPNEMESRAAEALDALLHQVSSIKTRDIRFQPVRRRSDFVASVDVLGRNHKLVCNVADGDPNHVREALNKLTNCAESKKTGATPVLITPKLSEQTRALCAERRVGCLDLEGNARLTVDEVFIGKRSVHSVKVHDHAVRYQA